MDEVEGEVALPGGVIGSVWREGGAPPTTPTPNRAPPPSLEPGSCLSGPVGAQFKPQSTLHYIPIGKISPSYTSRLFCNSRLKRFRLGL